MYKFIALKATVLETPFTPNTVVWKEKQSLKSEASPATRSPQNAGRSRWVAHCGMRWIPREHLKDNNRGYMTGL